LFSDQIFKSNRKMKLDFGLMNEARKKEKKKRKNDNDIDIIFMKWLIQHLCMCWQFFLKSRHRQQDEGCNLILQQQ